MFFLFSFFFKFYLQVSPRSLRPRPRTPPSTPTDCLKDHPAILSHTSKRNSTLHSLLLVATWGRHGTADYYRPLQLGMHTLYHSCPLEVRWEVTTLPDNHFKLRVYSKLWGALKSLHSHRQLLLNCGTQDLAATETTDTETVELLTSALGKSFTLI